MNQQALTPIIAVFVILSLQLWKTPSVRVKVFAFVPKLPRSVQWIAPLLISTASAAGEGYLGGITGADLFEFAMSNGAEIASLSIAIWHVSKRIVSQPNPATLTILALGFGFSQFSCASLRPSVDKVVIFEQQVHTEAQNLQVAAFAVIPLLPVGQQDVARAQLARAFERLTVVMDIKDNAVQAAIASSQDTIDVASLVTPCIAAIEEIIVLVKSFGSDTTHIEKRAMQLRKTMGVQ
jgi:hypothetical protein